MQESRNRRIVALALAVITASLLQACAVTTGSFYPSRASATNRSMTSHYDVTHLQIAPNTPHSTMTTTHEKGFQDYRYY